MRLLESVPNISEGRDPSLIGELAQAFSSRGARLLDVHADPDHHRSVFTLVGQEEDLVESLLAGIGVACERIDLRQHDGAHPRVGITDVVPIVPLERHDMDNANAVAEQLGLRIAAELGLPVFFYGEIGGGRRPAFFRRGGPEELQRRVDAGELSPAHGPRKLDPSRGAVLVGARAPLVAFNVELTDGTLEIAQEIAATVRESSGGMSGVQAIGLLLATTGNTQVSMNIVDIERAALHEVVNRVRLEASRRGVGVARGELVGLLPASVVRAAAGCTEAEPLDPRALDRAAHALALEGLSSQAVLDPIALGTERA